MPYWKNDSRCIQSLQAGFPTAPSSKDLDSSCQDLTFDKEKREVQDAESQKKMLGNANSCKQNLQRLQLIKGASAGIAGVVNLARPGQDGQGTSHQKTGFFLVSTCSTQTAKAAKTVDRTFCRPGPAPSPSLLSSCFCSGGLSRTRAP